MDTLDMCLLIFAGVVLSMAGQLALISLTWLTAHLAGEDAKEWEPSRWLSLVLWPLTLVFAVSMWTAALVHFALIVLTSPSDDDQGGPAC